MSGSRDLEGGRSLREFAITVTGCERDAQQPASSKSEVAVVITVMHQRIRYKVSSITTMSRDSRMTSESHVFRVFPTCVCVYVCESGQRAAAGSASGRGFTWHGTWMDHGSDHGSCGLAFVVCACAHEAFQPNRGACSIQDPCTLLFSTTVTVSSFQAVGFFQDVAQR